MKSAETKNHSKIIYILCFLTFGVPFLFGYGIVPLTNFTAEIIAATGFGLLLIITSRKDSNYQLGYISPLLLAPAIVLTMSCIAQYATKGFNHTDAYLTVIGYFLLSAAGIYFGNMVAAQPNALHWPSPIAITILFAGLVAAGGSAAQYFSVDGQSILLSPVSDSGRTFGFIRQPNHQGGFLSLAIASCLFLHQIGKLGPATAIFSSTLLTFALLTTGSRTALIQLFSILSIAFLFSRNPTSKIRGIALSIAAFTIIAWTMLYWSASSGGLDFYGNQKLTQTASEGFGVRKTLWLQTMQMIGDCHWTGCGILHYPATYYLGGYSTQTGLVFSNAHNIVLQLAFDHGILVLATVIFLAALGLIKAKIKINSPAKNYALSIIFCIGVHSMLEFPLWYTYFLIPASFFWGFLLCPNRPQDAQNRKTIPTLSFSPAPIIVGTLTIATCVTMTQDYYKITPIYTPGIPSTLEQRVAAAQEAYWFDRFKFFPIFQKDTLFTSFPETNIDKAVELGCIMSEPWHQTSMIKVLADNGFTADVKWLLYLYKKMTNGNMDIFAATLQTSRNEAAQELIAYTKDPNEPKKSTEAFRKFCE